MTLFAQNIGFDEHPTYINVCPFTELSRWIIEREHSTHTRFLVVHLPQGYDVKQLETDYERLTAKHLAINTALVGSFSMVGYEVSTYDTVSDLDHGKIAIAHVNDVGTPLQLDARTKNWFTQKLKEFAVTVSME